VENTVTSLSIRDSVNVGAASRAALAALAALTLVAAQAAPTDSATFGRAPLPKGVRLVATASNEQNVKSTVKGGGVEQAIDGATKVEFGWTVAVTESDEKGAKAASIDVTRADIHVVTPLGEQDEASKVVGRTWLATRSDDGWSFAAKEGAPPDDEGLVTLRAIAARALDPSPIAAALDGRRLAVGETLKLPADDAKRLLATLAESWTVKAFELKLASIAQRDEKARESARFEMKTTLVTSGIAAAGADATLDLSGELVVATSTSLVLRASLAGPVRLDGRLGGGAGEVRITGSGDAKWSYAAELKE
jgi:hypothetical protein